MKPCDVPQVVEIDRESFPTQKYLPPFKQELKNKAIHLLVLHETDEGNCDKTNDGNNSKPPKHETIQAWVIEFGIENLKTNPIILNDYINEQI